jgi:hypothetical protein
MLHRGSQICLLALLCGITVALAQEPKKPSGAELRSSIFTARPEHSALVATRKLPAMPCGALPGGRSGTEGAISVSRGFDAETGDPWVESKFADGTVLRMRYGGADLTTPDGVTQPCYYQRAMSGAIAPTPPELPADDSRGRAWMQMHSDNLLAIIRKQVNNDEAQMAIAARKEAEVTHGDLFKQIEFRTEIVNRFAAPRP